jgi:hypothetical protein
LYLRKCDLAERGQLNEKVNEPVDVVEVLRVNRHEAQVHEDGCVKRCVDDEAQTGKVWLERDNRR